MSYSTLQCHKLNKCIILKPLITFIELHYWSPLFLWKILHDKWSDDNEEVENLFSLMALWQDMLCGIPIIYWNLNKSNCQHHIMSCRDAIAVCVYFVLRPQSKHIRIWKVYMASSLLELKIANVFEILTANNVMYVTISCALKSLQV